MQQTVSPQLSSVNGEQSSCRLFVKDPLSKVNFLVDSGAEISVLPKRFCLTRPESDNIYCLTAANGVPIRSYGNRYMKLSLGLRRHFPHIFVIADVNYPIIGADFLQKHGLLLDFRHKRVSDSQTHLSVDAISRSVSSNEIPSITKHGSTQYDQLLNSFPNLCKPPDYHAPIKHAVVHHRDYGKSPILYSQAVTT